MPKRNGMCPMCYIKKLLLGSKTIERAPTEIPYETEVQKTPLMGWSSWNTFKNRIDETLIYDTAKAMKESGLADAGYSYINLDDCWQSNLRDENGDLQGDLTTFANGIPSLVDKINKLGLKVGLYSSNGTLTCEDLPASLGREKADAMTLANWGVEYFKYDFCHNIKISEYAPLVYGITLSKKGETERKQYLCSNAILKGLARRMPCKDLDGGKYVSGLDNGKGSLLFDNINVEKGGEYILTVDIKKKGMYEKFLLAKINGKDLYQIDFPPQKFFNLTARFQVPVVLKNGVNTIELFNPISNNKDSAALQYQKMAYALKAATAKVATQNHTAEKPILFSICEWGWRKPWVWGTSAGNMWRTTPDIMPKWRWIIMIYNRTVKLHEYASAGHFNDPDMLEVGNGNLTYAENMAHFALWCMMCSPLVLGNDIRKISKPVLEIVTNKALIAINQDPLAKQAKRMKSGKLDILAKPLADGSVALCFFNKGDRSVDVSYDFAELCQDNFVAMAKGERTVVEIIGKCAKTAQTLTATLNPHAVVVIRLV